MNVLTPDPNEEQELLPHHTNIERVERRIFEVHAYWRHTATLLGVGFGGLVVVQLGVALWLALPRESAEPGTLYFLCAVCAVMFFIGLLGAQVLQAASKGLQRSDRTINTLEVEIQRITSSPGYILNNEIMPLELYLKALGLMRGTLYLLLSLWLVLPALLFLFPRPEPTAHPAKPLTQKSLERPNRGKN